MHFISGHYVNRQKLAIFYSTWACGSISCQHFIDVGRQLFIARALCWAKSLRVLQMFSQHFLHSPGLSSSLPAFRQWLNIFFLSPALLLIWLNVQSFMCNKKLIICQHFLHPPQPGGLKQAGAGDLWSKPINRYDGYVK